MTRARGVLAVLAETGRHPIWAVAHCLFLAGAVAALVLALAVGAGSERAARQPFQGLQPDAVVVTATSPSSSGVEIGLPSPAITPDDVQALSAKGFVPDAASVAPTAGLHTTVGSLARSVATDVIGTTPAFAPVRGYTVARGRFLTAADVAGGVPVVVVGQSVVDGIFGGHDAVGEEVQINKHFFEVAGVLNRMGFSGALNQDNLVLMPITTAWSALLQNTTVVDQVLIRAVSRGRADAVKAEVTTTLLQRHQLTNPAAADFEVHTVRDLTNQQRQAARSVARTLGLAAGALFLLAAIHLHTTVARRPTSGAPRVDLFTLVVLSTGLGIALAAAPAGAVGQLIGGIPAPDVRWRAVAWAAAAGLLVGGLASLRWPNRREHFLRPRAGVREGLVP